VKHGTLNKFGVQLKILIMRNRKLFKMSIISIIICHFVTSCTKLVEVDPPTTSTNADLVYANDQSAIGVLTSIYAKMSENNIINGGIKSMPLFTGLYADEFVLNSGINDISTLGYYSNNLTSSTTGGADFWTNIYPIIFTVNSALEGISSSNSLSAPVKKQLLGEAKFMRAFCYMYLVNLYGDVPLVTVTDYRVNSLLPRTPVAQVYNKIFMDLKEAEDQLSENYIDGTLVTTSTERTSPNKWVARALLARVYLYMKDYINAENYASLLINNKTLFDTVALDNVFLTTSKEAIWQLQSVGSFVTNTYEGLVFGLSEFGPNNSDNPVYLSPGFIDNFDKGDLRRTKWINSVEVEAITYYYPYKYKENKPFTPVSEYSMVFRLAEQYLIRAEARINQSKIPEGIADLNILRDRARGIATAIIPDPLPPISISLSKHDALLAVEKERQLELFTEWGHRWFDLKRTPGIINPSTSRADEVLSVKEGSSWQVTDTLFPIPQIEIDKNPSLKGHQNAGYN
jgi:starch-binding outer membrane protein, SusD/RagB family